MPSVEMRPVRPGDLEAIAPRLRAADTLEIQRSRGKSNLAVLQESVEASRGRAGVVLFDGQLACAYGVVQHDHLGCAAVPWLLTTDVVEQHKLTFFRIAKFVVDRWAEEYPVLVQLVDDEYEGAKDFLRALGFQLQDAVPHGPLGAPFRPAVRIRNV